MISTFFGELFHPNLKHDAAVEIANTRIESSAQIYDGLSSSMPDLYCSDPDPSALGEVRGRLTTTDRLSSQELHSSLMEVKRQLEEKLNSE